MGLFWSKVVHTLDNTGKGFTSRVMSSVVGDAGSWLQGKLAGSGNTGGVKFYYMSGPGGSVFSMAARKAGGIAASMAKEAADDAIKAGANALKKLINGKGKDNSFDGNAWTYVADDQASIETSLYGKLHDVNAYDDYGNVCYDAVMLAIPVSPPVTHYAQTYGFVGTLGETKKRSESVTNNFLVWYDTVGLVSVNSDKNVVLTQVAGRDYSRKELVSNGDVRFSVSGHITSNLPDCYPRDEVQKFREIMRYRGIVEVNNQIFDQWGVKYIVITSFNMPTNEGSKSVQDYSFECVGIQPEQEAEVTTDTINVHAIDRRANVTTNSSGTWLDILKNAATGAIDTATDIATQGTAIATGIFNKQMNKW